MLNSINAVKYFRSYHSLQLKNRQVFSHKVMIMTIYSLVGILYNHQNYISK